MYGLIKKMMHSMTLQCNFQPILRLEKDEVEWLGLHAYVQCKYWKERNHVIKNYWLFWDQCWIHVKYLQECFLTSYYMQSMLQIPLSFVVLSTIFLQVAVWCLDQLVFIHSHLRFNLWNLLFASLKSLQFSVNVHFWRFTQ